MFKKLIALLLAAVFAAVSLAACEPKDNGEDTTVEETDDAGDTGDGGETDPGTDVAS